MPGSPTETVPKGITRSVTALKLWLAVASGISVRMRVSIMCARSPLSRKQPHTSHAKKSSFALLNVQSVQSHAITSDYSVRGVSTFQCMETSLRVADLIPQGKPLRALGLAVLKRVTSINHRVCMSQFFLLSYINLRAFFPHHANAHAHHGGYQPDQALDRRI
jgi:hypothetical protein